MYFEYFLNSKMAYEWAYNAKFKKHNFFLF